MENTNDNNNEQNNEPTTSASSVEQLKVMIENPAQHYEYVDYKSLDKLGLREVILAILEDNPATVLMCYSDMAGTTTVGSKEEAMFMCKLEDELTDMFAENIIAASFIKGDISGVPFTRIIYGYSPHQLLNATLG